MILRTAPSPVFEPSGSSAEPSARRPTSAHLLGLKVVVVALVALQRFVVPGTTISVALPVVCAVLFTLVARGDVRADAGKVGLYVVAMGVAVLANVVSSVTGNPWASLNSL